jgi:hypothetical protein
MVRGALGVVMHYPPGSNFNTYGFPLEVFEEGLTRRELLWVLFDHCCCRCRHEGVANAGASCAPLKLAAVRISRSSCATWSG